MCFNVTVNRDNIAILGMDELSDEEKNIADALVVSNSSVTKLNVAEQFMVNQVLMFLLLKQSVALKKSLKVNMIIFQKTPAA